MADYPYIFVETHDICYNTRLKGVSLDEEWLKIYEDGRMVLLGSNPRCEGYAWDGCSPKFFFWDIHFGTPDGIIGPDEKKPKTYYASLIHDVLYQYRDKLRPKQVSRKVTDLIFLDEMRQRNFRLSKLYYQVVRLFGWIYWQNIIKKYPWSRFVFLVFFLVLVWLFFLGLSSLVRWIF